MPTCRASVRAASFPDGSIRPTSSCSTVTVSRCLQPHPRLLFGRGIGLLEDDLRVKFGVIEHDHRSHDLDRTGRRAPFGAVFRKQLYVGGRIEGIGSMGRDTWSRCQVLRRDTGWGKWGNQGEQQAHQHGGSHTHYSHPPTDLPKRAVRTLISIIAARQWDLCASPANPSPSSGGVNSESRNRILLRGFRRNTDTGIRLVRIAAISDLHIWGPISKKLITEFDELHERADVLVIAGDITNNGLLVQAERARDAPGTSPHPDCGGPRQPRPPAPPPPRLHDHPGSCRRDLPRRHDR